jgi:predicted phage terminase large subunit-like protein
MSAEPCPADALSRNNFEFFFRRVFPVLNPGVELREALHVQAIAHRLDQLTKGDIKRLIMNVPPRYLKSQITAIAYPAWLLGRDPTCRILVTSYGSSLTESLHEQFKRLVEHPLYQQIFPHMRANVRKSTATVYRTGLGGSREAIPMGGAITGHGYNYIIIDDPMKAADARSPVERENVINTYRDTLYSRLQPKETARMVVIMQRLHEDDLTGFLLEQTGWTHLNLPAIAQIDEIIPLGNGQVFSRRIGDVLCPEWESAETLEATRQSITNPIFRAQYLMDPSVGDGSGVQWSRLHFYDQAPAREDCEMVVISWDTASSLTEQADYSVGTVWGFHRKKWYLLDLIRGKYDGEDLVAEVHRSRAKWRPDQIVVEKHNSGVSLIQRLIREQRGDSQPRVDTYGCIHLAFEPRDNKQDRMMMNVDRLYNGDFLFPRAAVYLEGLRRELTSFPGGKHDDQVDSISQFIIHAGGRSVRGHFQEVIDNQVRADRAARLWR